jgi:hypothetical protein
MQRPPRAFDNLPVACGALPGAAARAPPPALARGWCQLASDARTAPRVHDARAHGACRLVRAVGPPRHSIGAFC